MQDFIQLSAAVYELSCAQGINSEEKQYMSVATARTVKIQGLLRMRGNSGCNTADTVVKNRRTQKVMK